MSLAMPSGLVFQLFPLGGLYRMPSSSNSKTQDSVLPEDARRIVSNGLEPSGSREGLVSSSSVIRLRVPSLSSIQVVDDPSPVRRAVKIRRNRFAALCRSFAYQTM